LRGKYILSSTLSSGWSASEKDLAHACVHDHCGRDLIGSMVVARLVRRVRRMRCDEVTPLGSRHLLTRPLVISYVFHQSPYLPVVQGGVQTTRPRRNLPFQHEQFAFLHAPYVELPVDEHSADHIPLCSYCKRPL